MLGDAMEGLGVWGQARRCDEVVRALYDNMGPHASIGEVLSSIRRDCITSLRVGEADLALACGMKQALPFYIASLDERGIIFTQMNSFLPAMAAIKV